MASSAFGSKKRPAGKVYRSYGPLARLVTDIYNDVESGFVATETSITGSASTGVDGANIQYTPAQAAGALTVCTVPVVLRLTIADSEGDQNFTGLIGKHVIVDVQVFHTAIGHANDTYQLKRIQSGVTNITNAITPGSAIGAIGRAATVDPTYSTVNSGSGLKVTTVKGAPGGTSLAAVMIITLLPVA